jgi:hypothetical protein
LHGTPCVPVQRGAKFGRALPQPSSVSLTGRDDVARFQGELDKASTNKSISNVVRLRAGYSAVSDLATAKVNVADLVHRAESALDHAPIQGDRSAIVSFDDLPTS